DAGFSFRAEQLVSDEAGGEFYDGHGEASKRENGKGFAAEMAKRELRWRSSRPSLSGNLVLPILERISADLFCQDSLHASAACVDRRNISGTVPDRCGRGFSEIAKGLYRQKRS
ncbi:MAG: hypothetical protein KDI64_19100, partial [Candidatus Accumulibacter sp.]|nr:hypothetical protein [Accumulibacter sp.]